MSEGIESTVGSKLKEVGRHSVVYGLGSVAQSAVQFLLIPILTAAFSLNEFGAFSLVQMVATISSSIFYLGMTSALPRSYFDYQDERDRKSVFTTAFILLLSGALVQVLVGLVGGRLLSQAVLRTPNYAGAMAWALAGGALSFINQYFFSWLRFLRKSIVSVLFSILTLTGSIGLSVSFIRLHHGSVTAPFVAICLTQGLVMLVFLVAFGRQAFTFRLIPREFSILLSYGIPVVLTVFATILIDWSDRIIIERSISLGAAGLYSAAFKLGTLINVLLILPFGQIWSPMMMEYRRHANIQEFFTRVISYFFVAGGLVIIVASLFIRNLLPLLIRSQRHEEVVSVMLLVMFGYLIYGYTNICSAGLIYARKMYVFAYVYYGVAAIKFSLNMFVIPAFGLNGAALTTVLGNILIPAGLYIISRKYFPIQLEKRRLGILFLLVGIPFGYSLFLEPLFPLPWTAKLPLALGFVVSVYLFCTTRKEKAWLQGLFPIQHR